jgi:outer membrane protein OmpA-like peptidoglycan-associated protein
VAAKDSDGDGVPDDKDACPDDAGVKTNDPKTNGCPPPTDTDKDGVLDADDACPSLAGIKSDDPKKNGCPPDTDGDGIPDPVDACPDVAGVKQADPTQNGCPPDSDRDGIIDEEDACPDVPGIKTDDPQTNGCPDTDRDKDGIKNDVDACPDEAGPANPDPHKNGCPKAFVKNGQIRIMEQVKFKTASAQILPGKDSEEVLAAVAKVMADHPEIAHVTVEGHTDNRGDAKGNKRLSEQRAASVVKWLVSHGVGQEKLSSIGYGQERPLDSNSTEEGRKNNRRVEFHIEAAANKE